MKGFIKRLLRESLINEVAKGYGDLPKDTGLFIKPINQGATMTLYSIEEKKAYATITVGYSERMGPYYYVYAVAAVKGFGPFIYELAMMYVNSKNNRLMPSRDGDIEPEAFNVWKVFYNRNDVNKNTFELNNKDYRFDILKKSIGNNVNKEELWNGLTDEDKFNLTVFNSSFTLQPNSDYNTLVDIATKNKNYSDIADRAGDALWEKIGN